MRRIKATVRRLAEPRSGDAGAIRRLERELGELRAEIDELRADSARIAELYDVVVERLSDRND